MAVEMIITIREEGNKTHIEVVSHKSEGATPNEIAHSVAMAGVIAAVAKDVSSGKLGCDCPKCRAARENAHGRSDLH